MTHDPRSAPSSPSLETLLEHARAYALDARAPSTRRAYATDWDAFAGWCQRVNMSPLPAPHDVVAAYLADLAGRGRKVATIARALTAIAQRHIGSGLPSPRTAPIVRETLRGIRRRLGVAPTQKAPVLAEDLRALVASLPDSIRGTRDRAVLLLGFGGAFRRSELVALDIEDLQFTADGLRVIIRRSKTDPLARGRTIGVSVSQDAVACPVAAAREWIERAKLVAGPLFRPLNKAGRVLDARLHSGSVASIVKDRLRELGRDPASYAGHSLRRGFATSAARAGASEREIARTTGHADLNQLRTYVLDVETFPSGRTAR